MILSYPFPIFYCETEKRKTKGHRPGLHLSPVVSPHKGQWRGALIFSLTCAWANGWANNRDTGDFGRHGAHCDVTAMVNFEVALLSLWQVYNYPSNNAVILKHCGDVIISTKASQISGASIVYSTLCSGTDQRKHQTFASPALWGNSSVTGEFPAKGQWRGKCYHLMTS